MEILWMSGCNSVVECQLPKLDVAGSSPVARSIFFFAGTLPTVLLQFRIESHRDG